jgi:hypothetical protein
MSKPDPKESPTPPDREAREDNDGDQSNAERAVDEQRRQEETGQESPVV